MQALSCLGDPRRNLPRTRVHSIPPALYRRIAQKVHVKKTGAQLDREIAESLRSRPTRAGHASKRETKKSSHEIKTSRLKTLRGIMQDALGDDAWSDTDLSEIEKWISVDADLSDREWLEIAKNQLLDASVLPEHAGAPPPNVYAWNDAFISTYRMNIDEGMRHEDAIDSARQNAYDTVSLTRNEHGLTKTDPKLYKD